MGVSVKIGLGDCLDLLDRVGEGTVDLVLTDLPYGVTKCSWDTLIPFKPLWEHFERVTKPEGLVVLFGTEPFSSMCRVSNIKRYRYDWIWRKNRATGFLDANSRPLKDYENIMVFYSSDFMLDTTNFFQKSKEYLIGEKRKAELAGFKMREVLGNYMGNHYFVTKKQFTFPNEENYKKLQSTGYFQRDYKEVLEVYESEKGVRGSEKGRVTYNPQFGSGKPYRSSGGGIVSLYKEERLPGSSDGKRYPKQVLEFSHDPGGYHPTQKPVSLLEYLIMTYTNDGETVLDCCMGSGSTGVACVNTGRNFIGIEIEEKYFNISDNRIREAFIDSNVRGSIDIL